jgi:hypothetical protein
MSNSTTNLDTISTAQSNKEAVANALFDASSPASLWGRHASACNLLTWGYYGGSYTIGTTVNTIANGTLTLAASTTTYVQADPTTGLVTQNTSGFTAGQIPLYKIVTGATTVTSYTDCRSYAPSATGGGGGGGSGTVTSVGGAGGVESPTGAITTSGTLRETMLMAGGAIQTAAYTLVTGDRGTTLVMNSASSVAETLPTPTGNTLTTNFPKGWFCWLQNIGSGTTTVGVPSGLSLDGVTNGTVSVAPNNGIGFFTDGANWFSIRGIAGSGGGGGSGTVTSVAGAGGIESPTGAITTAGTLRETLLMAGGSAHTGAYTFVTGDRGTTLVLNSASAITQNLPTPTGNTLTTNFPQGWFCWIQNIGAGLVTLAVPAGTNLDGVANGTLAVPQNSGLGVFTDGSNWYTVRGIAGAGGTFAGLSDVAVTSPADGQVTIYNGPNSKWTNTYAPDEGGFIDGNMDSWQVNGTNSISVPAATDTYTADMWIANSGTGGAMTAVLLQHLAGSEPTWYTRGNKNLVELNQTTAATTNPTFGQKLEGVEQYNGQTITVQAAMNFQGGSFNVVGVRVTQNFGTGGSPSATVVTTSPALNWTGSGTTKYSAEIAIPSISGKTIGANGNDFVRIDLLFATGATGLVTMSQLQIDVSPPGINPNTTGDGGVPQQFRWRGLGPEMLRVQRHVNAISFPSSGVLATASLVSATTSVCGVAIQAMRAIPSCSIVGTLSLVFPSGTSSSVSAAAVQNTFVRVIGVHSGATAGQAGYLSGTGTAGIIIADARL